MLKRSLLSLVFVALLCHWVGHAYECHNVGPDEVFYDESCSDPLLPSTGCNAGGQGQNCRFCNAALDRCKAAKSTTRKDPQTTAGPVVESTTHRAPTTTGRDPGDRCKTDPLSQTACTKRELTTTCQCNTGLYCCLEGDAVKGCSPNPWAPPACTCACQVADVPIENCSWEDYLFSPCDPKIAPYYCPSINGCGPKPYACGDICFLPEVPPYPERPADKGTYTPSKQPRPQPLQCGAQTVTTPPACAVQPGDAAWSHTAERRQKCNENGWWCPERSPDWKPSKFQCGPTMDGDDSLCPIAQIQAQECRAELPYKAPEWAPQPLTENAFCDTVAGLDCKAVNNSQRCVGCCLWDNPHLKCGNFYDFGAGKACRRVSPRFNWIITTCDSMGGQDFGGACQQNPFTTLNVKYVASYQLERIAEGRFGWKLNKESSLNWNGAEEFVDFSKLPTEHTVVGGGPIRSCSGGGGDWNGAFFPYKVDGVTPPAMMFVLSYTNFDNAAWFMLNQRILDGGPATSTCKDMTNCWGEISAGEIDFLETPNLFPNKMKTKEGWNILRVTSYNAANRCFACNHANKDGTLNNACCGGEPANSWYNANHESEKQKAHYWAVVIDARGTTVYKDPVWPGMTLNCTAEELLNLHPAKPEQQTPCEDPTKTCAIFLPSCVTDVTEKMSDPIANGHYSRIPQCWVRDFAVHTTCTENWWNLMVDSGQWMVRDPDFIAT